MTSIIHPLFSPLSQSGFVLFFCLFPDKPAHTSSSPPRKRAAKFALDLGWTLLPRFLPSTLNLAQQKAAAVSSKRRRDVPRESGFGLVVHSVLDFSGAALYYNNHYHTTSLALTTTTPNSLAVTSPPSISREVLVNGVKHKGRPQALRRYHPQPACSASPA